jgi:hypothetical protein
VGPIAGKDGVQKTSPPPEFDLLTVQPVAMPSKLSILRFRSEIKERKHEKERK